MRSVIYLLISKKDFRTSGFTLSGAVHAGLGAIVIGDVRTADTGLDSCSGCHLSSLQARRPSVKWADPDPKTCPTSAFGIDWAFFGCKQVV